MSNYTLSFTPVIPLQPFQVEMVTDTTLSVISFVDPNNFEPVNNLVSVEFVSPEQKLTYYNDGSGSRTIRIRSITETIPGAWSDTLFLLQNIPNTEYILYTVDIIPAYMSNTVNIRWKLENGDISFGPYIGNIDNIQYILPGTYILSVIDLAGNKLSQQNVTIDSNNTTSQIFLNTNMGALSGTFSVPDGVDKSLFSYILISDFASSSLTNNYDNQQNQYDVGLYYIVVLYQNQILSALDDTVNFGVYINKDDDKTLLINIVYSGDVFKIESIS
jgi:hypothetical protein